MKKETLEKLSELNTQKFTVKEVSSIMHTGKFLSRILCEMAVRQKEFEKFQEDGITYYKLKKEK